MNNAPHKRWINYVGFWFTLFLATSVLVVALAMADRIRKGTPEQEPPATATRR